MQPYHQQPRWGMPPGNRPRFGPGPPPHRGPGPMYGGHQQRHYGPPTMGQHRGPPGPYRGHPPRPGGPPHGGPHRFPVDRHMRPQMGPRNPFQPQPIGSPPPRPGFEPFMRPQGQGFGPKNFAGGKPQGGGQKKAKVDKRDLPENNKFYCDICDRGYKDEDKYQTHIDTHEKCPEAGCSYVAAGKLVKLHISLQHRSGLAKKIWSLESPEDIQKWRNERKKNFPTTENVARKKEIIADKIARGEVIEEKYFGKMRMKHGGKFERGRGRGRGRSRGGRPDNQSSEKLDHNQNQQKGDTEGSTSQKRKLSPEEEASGDAGTAVKQQRVAGATGQVVEGATDKDTGDPLAAFFGAASSDSDSGDDDTEEATSHATPQKAAGALGSLISSYEVDGSDEEGTEAGSAAKQSTQKQRDTDNTQKNRQRSRHGKRGKDKYQPPPKMDKSLLEKLLAKEIRQERNKILQCVHYIAKNNFFDVKSDSTGS